MLRPFDMLLPLTFLYEITSNLVYLLRPFDMLLPLTFLYEITSNLVYLQQPFDMLLPLTFLYEITSNLVYFSKEISVYYHFRDFGASRWGIPLFPLRYRCCALLLRGLNREECSPSFALKVSQF